MRHKGEYKNFNLETNNPNDVTHVRASRVVNYGNGSKNTFFVPAC